MSFTTVRTLATLEKVHLALEKVRAMRAANPKDEVAMERTTRLENAAVSVLSFIAYNLRNRQFALNEQQNKVLTNLETLLKTC